MAKAYLLLGGNIDNRQYYIESATHLIHLHAGSVVEKSSVYETVPWGFTEGPYFLNQVLGIETKLGTKELFKTIVYIENQLGRTRNGGDYSSRTIDIDILFYENEVVSSEELIIPHPKIRERKFVLEPMSELNPKFIHPVEKKTIEELLWECADPLEVIKLSN